VFTREFIAQGATRTVRRFREGGEEMVSATRTSDEILDLQTGRNDDLPEIGDPASRNR